MHTTATSPRRKTVAEREHDAAVARMAETIIDVMIRQGRAEIADIERAGFLKSEIEAMRGEALKAARASRPDLFRMEAA